MIVGLGIDIAEVDRMREAIERRGQALVKRVFTPGEIAYCQRHCSNDVGSICVASDFLSY